ncbi:hypothetical protein QE152_g31489 [Popillia japonica]|uniref:Uncharacterized protein n=1 Tax=Popillia japonica TaxID=7064 RepID=A0AAW1J1B2_POPJA
MDPNELDEDLMELRKKEREQVREFIEKLVESMLGGNLDEVNVSRVYNDKKYLPITGQSPCSAHAYLKNLIERFTNEASELPNLIKYESHPAHPEETISNRSYEDLLSTAIINKVVQVNQNEARSSTASSRASEATRRSGNKEYFFGDETLENKWKNQDNIRDDASSVSSLDDWVRSDSSIGSSKYVDRMSLTIKQHIEEGSISDDEDLDNASYVQDIHSSDENWHENWYFQKRRLTNSNSPVPVPMLVPNPITEAKVLIGDKEAEEFSDRDSDYGDPELVPDIKNILVNSKTIIGGKNPIPSVDETDNMIHSTEDILTSNTENNEPTVTDDARKCESTDTLQRNEVLNNGKSKKIIEANIITEYSSETTQNQNSSGDVLNIPESYNEDVSLISLESNTEQDTEYTEQYASLPRTYLKSSKLVPRAQVNEQHEVDSIPLPSHELRNGNSKINENSSDSDEEAMRVFAGSYSEREKEKWKHSSVEIPDNPYSPENLERRLSGRSSSSSTSSRFGRDYYVRNAAKSAGARQPHKLLTESEVAEFSPTLNSSGINSEDAAVVVTAVPVLVNSEESNDFYSMSDSSIISPTKLSAPHDISSDSDLSIERVYNLQSGKVFEKKGNVSQEISIKDSYSPEGLKYVPKEFDEEVQSRTDENHNNTGIQSSKQAFMRSLTQLSDEAADIVKNDYLFVDTIPNVNEEIIEVPYDENKFKATLEIFNVIPETAVTNKGKSEKSEVVKHIISDVETVKIDTETVFNEDEIDTIKSYAIDSVTQNIPLSFGEVKKIVDNKVNTSDYSEEEVLSDNREFSLEYSTDLNGDEVSRTDSSLETDPEIIDLKEKRLVKDLLDIIKDYESTVSQKPPDDEELDVIRSVKNLKQLFDKGHNIQIKKDPKQIYSLTARSLSMQFRQKLKSDDEASLSPEANIVDGNVGVEETEEVLPIDITKNRIAFFEHLGSNK